MKTATTSIWALAAVLALALPASAEPKSPSTLQKGYRGVTLPAARHQLVNVKPGDRVDVLVTFIAKLPKGDEQVTATILQNVAVLAVSKPDETIELLLNPNEAQYAALSVDKDKGLWFIVRAAGDDDMKPLEMASFRKLFR